MPTPAVKKMALLDDLSPALAELESIMIEGLMLASLSKTWQNTGSYIAKLFTMCYEVKVHTAL